MMNISDLLNPKEVLVLNLLDYISELDIHYSSYFADPYPGIYIANKVEPVLLPNTVYYTDDGIRFTLEDFEIDKYTGSVTDEYGNMLLSRYVMSMQKSFLSKTPTLPVFAIKIAHIYALSVVDDATPYVRDKTKTTEAIRYLKPGGYIYVYNGMFSIALDELLKTISEFINNDIWNIYFIKLNNTDLIIEKSIDYRIYEWHKLKYHSSDNTPYSIFEYSEIGN